MPLAFKDEPVKKGKNEKDLELFSGPRKGFPMHLEGQVLPELIKKVGDVKSGRVSMARVDDYLIRNTLLFDRDLLKKMFDEADYKKEGSLDHRTMAMALTGRFPKWQFMKEWRRLVAMILDLTDLILSEDHVNVQLFEGEAKTFNSDSFWSDELPALPPVPKRVWARRRRGTASPSRDGTSAAESSSTSPPDPSSPARQQGSSSAFGATGLPSLADSALRTAGGLKATGQIGAEVTINRTLESQLARSTFESAREFKDFSAGLELSSKLSALDASVVARGQGTGGSLSTAALPKGVRAWNATLPPAAVYLPAPALQTLRNSIRSVTSTQADFVTMHRPLDTSALDQKKVLGEQLDVKASLARVEPVREPRVLYNADYVSAQDYGAHCRTAPSRWYNEYYPAAEGQERPPAGGGMGSTYLRACPY